MTTAKPGAIGVTPIRGWGGFGIQMQITAGANDLQSILLEKRDGSHVLLLWRRVDVYTPAKGGGAYTTIEGVDTTVQLQNPATVTWHRPSEAASNTAIAESMLLGSGITTFTIPEMKGDVVAAVIK